MIDLLKYKKYYFIISIALILAGIIGLLVNGLNYDIQFKGGTIIEIEMENNDYDANKIGVELTNMLNKKVSSQKLQAYNPENKDKEINILMLKIPGTAALNEDEINMIIEYLTTYYNAGKVHQMENVQPFIAAEMKQKGVEAVLVASVLIIIYIWYRFSSISGLPAAITALLALMHDLAIMFSAYTIFKVPLNESFIAAALTILGYSINNTIVVYDRIRENNKRMRKTSLDELVNKSVLQSFTRSVNTSVTTLIAVVIVYLYASINNIQSVKEFAFPLIIGLISGTYSSLFIAPSLWFVWEERKTRQKIVTKQVKVKAR